MACAYADRFYDDFTIVLYLSLIHIYILVEAAAVADADHTLQWKERMLERNAVHITKEHSMTDLSLILLMIVESRLRCITIF